jgi:hypothetical protein
MLFRLVLHMASSKDRCEVIREMIMHENELINHRLTWLCQIQGFLFAALAVTWKFPDSKYVRSIFCIVGILVAISSHYGLGYAVNAINRLHDKADDAKKSGLIEDCDLVIGFKGDKSTLQEKCLPWNCLPIIFVLVWVLISFMLYNPLSANGSTSIIFSIR